MRWVIILGFGFWYACAVVWIYRFIALISEGLAWIFVIVAAIAFYRFYFLEMED